ncbi:MAG: CBS domain-containing protein [Nitriliruptorales bacterium]|nr:CBS domain-containing protein [Nitriliruptorales bacterium]
MTAPGTGVPVQGVRRQRGCGGPGAGAAYDDAVPGRAQPSDRRADARAYQWIVHARRRVIARWRGENLMVGLAVAVGIATGLLAVVLIAGIRWVQALAYGGPPRAFTVLLAPLIGGLLVGVLARRLPEIGGGGVTPVMTSIALHAGRMRPAVAPAKLLASAASLGTGASGGREGPIVQIGGSVASTLGRMFALDDERMRTLIAAGAGAGIAASFNAPLTGIFFAIEIVIGGFRIRSLQTVVVTCVVASVTARELVGSSIAYQLSEPPVFGDARELLAYAALGLAAAFIGVAFSRGEHLVAHTAERIRLWPPLRTALGALCVGAIVLVLPEVFGTGDHIPASLGGATEPVERLLEGGFGTGYTAAAYTAALLVGKLVATCLAVGTGSSVGSFAPALFMGGALGATVSHLSEGLFGASPTDAGGLALVGAAAVLAGSARAPLTAILLAFELTNDYAMVLPLMLATGIAVLVSERIDPDSMYTRALRERGIIYAEPHDLDLMQTVTVGEVMTTDPPTVAADLQLSALIDTFSTTGHHGFAVVERGPAGPRLVGIVTLTDLGHPDRRGLDGEGLTAADVATRRCVTVTPADPVFRALRRMAAIDVGRLPVVAADDHVHLVGMFRRADLVAAYQRALTRTLGSQQRRASSRLRNLAGVSFTELTVDQSAGVADAAIRDVQWPGKTVVTSIRRGAEVVVPSGDTVLQPGDEVTVLTDPGSVDAIHALMGGRGDANAP